MAGPTGLKAGTKSVLSAHLPPYSRKAGTRGCRGGAGGGTRARTGGGSEAPRAGTGGLHRVHLGSTNTTVPEARWIGCARLRRAHSPHREPKGRRGGALLASEPSPIS
eukprot:6213469-Pleurochrysis_carterae.AAC.2